MKAPERITLPLIPQLAKPAHLVSPRRRSLIRPHHLLAPLVELMRELAESFAAVGDVVEDSQRWRDAADLVERARAVLRGDGRLTRDTDT